MKRNQYKRRQLSTKSWQRDWHSCLLRKSFRDVPDFQSIMFFVSYRIGGVEVDDDVGSTWRGEVEEISSKEFDRLAPTGDRSNTDCCCERSSAYVIVLLGCELRNTERVSARESERESGRVWTVELASKKERVREWTKPFSASAAFSKFYLFKNLFNSPSLCSSHPPLSFPPEFAFALISICLRFASPLGQSCLFLSRRLNSASTFLLRSVLRLPKVSGIFSSPFVSESRHAPAYPTRWGGGCASVQVNCLSERLGEKRDKLSKTIRRLTSGCMGNKTCKSKNCEPRISQFFLREWKFETCFAKQSHGEHFVVKVVYVSRSIEQ